MGIEGVQNRSIVIQEPVKPKESVQTESVRVQQPEQAVQAEQAEQAVYAAQTEKGTAQNEQEKEAVQQNAQRLKSAVKHANNNINRTGCEFSYHEETGRVSIRVYDKETKEVIREIPPEETLDLVERIWELAGILVDEKR